MGRKANNSSTLEEKTLNSSTILGNNIKENYINEKKQPGSKLNEKKTNKSAELTHNVQLNGNIQKKKENNLENKKINNVEENCVIKTKENKSEGNSGLQKKKKTNKKTKKDDNNKSNEDLIEEAKKEAKETSEKAKDGNIIGENIKKEDDNNSKEKSKDGKEKKEEEKKDSKKDIKLKEDERKKMENELNKKFLKITKIDNFKNINDKMEAEMKRKTEIELLISSINTSVSKSNAQTPRPINMKLSSVDIENKIKEAKLKKKKINPKNLEEVEEVNTYINYLEEQLNITKNYENFKNFQNRLVTLKKSCEEKLKENLKIINEIKIQEKKLKSVEKIIKLKKEKQNIQVKESDVINKEYSLPTDKYTTLIKPYNFMNRIQSKHFVYVDKINNNNFDKVCLYITGCKDDVENFITYLKNIDFTEKNYVHLSNKVFKIMLNICEGSFKKMEDDTNVFVHVDNDTLYYCGMKGDVENLKELIERAINEKNSNTKNVTKNIKLDSVLARGFNKGLLKDIENKTNTLIRMNYDSKTFEASATIKGSKSSDIEEAEGKLNDIFKNLDSEFVKFEERELFSLYKKCSYELNEIRKNLNLFIIRHDNGISLVGKKENINKALEILDYAKSIISNKTVKKKLTEEEAFLFNANYRSYIKSKTGAEVKIFNKSNYKELNISGNKNDIDKALQMIEDLLKKRKCTEVEINEKVIALLLSSKAQKIKEIEKDTSTSIQINKTNHIAQIYGHEDKIHLAKDILENLVLSESKESKFIPNNLYVTVEMSVETEHIGSIIGKKGRTINKIQEETFAKKIHIDKENKKIYIHGTQKTVDAAQKEILKILNRSKDDNSYYDRYKHSSNSVSAHRKSHKSTRSGRSNYRSESSKNGVYINTNDEKAFPSLHDVTNIQTKKNKKSANQANIKRQDEQPEVNENE
ncbi:PRE-binding protein, putative [Plasmodium relictum]|uniref:PRE-binding protein, putative n=1 Tax=Plasmodium relictum TaxID=85471 RepID=A0A1J1H435_PLARL|nr:PRE-binding protein, putative [Plasmodium relictum]CRG99671.1 PRE-binding protein, putative [Plasmodium relictum]